MKRWSSFFSFFLFFIFYISPALFIFIFYFLFFYLPRLYFLHPSYIYVRRVFLISYMIVSVIVCVRVRVYLCFVCYFSDINAYSCLALYLLLLFFFFLFLFFYFLLFSFVFFWPRDGQNY